MPPLEEEIPDEDFARYVALCDRVRERYEDARQRCQYLLETDTLSEQRVVPLVGIFPPVTQEQLQAAEGRIGFRLPALLRLLYTTIANGCFEPDKPGEPGWGAFLGIAGGYYYGYPYTRPPEHQWTIDNSTSHSGWRLEADTERRLIENHHNYIVCLEGMPDGFMGFCDAGCGGTYLLDLYTGHVYVSGVWCYSFDESGEETREGGEPCYASIYHAHSSLEELVESWLTHKYQTSQQKPSCLGIYGAHGLTPATFVALDEGDAPSEDERLDDDFFDSDDWKWYLQQPPLDAE